MSRSVTFRQRDLAAAMRAAKQAGFAVREIKIGRDGEIVIVAGEPGPAEQPVENEWDRVKDRI